MSAASEQAAVRLMAAVRAANVHLCSPVPGRWVVGELLDDADKVLAAARQAGRGGAR